jgi:p24 family protein delta-1
VGVQGYCTLLVFGLLILPSLLKSTSIMPSRRPTSLLLTLLGVLFLTLPSSAIKFALQSHRYPPAKCIWNTAHTNALVIVTANVGPGSGQRVDVEIVDSSPQKNVYLHKRNINDETRLAVTAHADGEVGVCFKNHLDGGAS